MSDEFSEADHERARRAGRQAMAKQAGELPARNRKPHPGWRFFFGWLAFTQLIAFIVAIVHLFHSINWPDLTGIGYLIEWPLLISPHWAAAIAAFGAFYAMFRAWTILGRPGQGS